MKKGLTRKNKKGFTLIELVVVIAILGILAAILVPLISGFIERANLSADISSARMLYSAGAMDFSTRSDWTVDPMVFSTDGDLQEFVGGTWPDPKSEDLKAGIFKVTVTSGGSVSVTANGLTYNQETSTFGS